MENFFIQIEPIIYSGLFVWCNILMRNTIYRIKFGQRPSKMYPINSPRLFFISSIFMGDSGRQNEILVLWDAMTSVVASSGNSASMPGFTPIVGNRLSFNGYWLNNAQKESQDGWGVSLEILWNLTNSLYGNHDKTRFGLIPYFGVGMLHNRQVQTNPFAISYGVIAQYGLTSRLKLNLELGCKTTFSDFDGYGKPNRFGGDNIFSLSAGVSFTLGNTGFRKVVDARPVMLDNSCLRELCLSLSDENDRLSRKSSNDDRIVAELKKILEIEGLLSRYGNIFNKGSDNDDTVSNFPVNDYSGLNSLRARLKGAKNDYSSTMLKNIEALDGIDDETDYIDNLINNESTDSISGLGFASDGGIPSNSVAVLNHNNYLALIKSGQNN